MFLFEKSNQRNEFKTNVFAKDWYTYDKGRCRTLNWRNDYQCNFSKDNHKVRTGVFI